MNMKVFTTSRVEGNHSIIKKYIRSNRSNLLTVFNRIEYMLISQFKKLEYIINYQTTKSLTHHCIPKFKNLIGQVSHFALSLLFTEIQKGIPKEDCKCSIIS